MKVNKSRLACVIVFLFMIFLGGKILSNTIIEYEDIEADAYNHMDQESIYYIQENGLHSFPFFFGETIYRYSLQSEKTSVVARTYFPWRGFIDFTVYNEGIIYEKNEITGGGAGIIEIVDEIPFFSKKIYCPNGSFVISEGNVFYCDNGGIYSASLSTGDVELFVSKPEDETQFFDEVTVKKGYLFSPVEFGDSIVIKKIADGKEYVVECLEEDYFYTVDLLDNQFFVSILGNSGDLIKADIFSGKIETLVEGDGFNSGIAYCMKTQGSRIYYNNQDGAIFEYNLKTDTVCTLIEFRDYAEFSLENIVDYKVHYNEAYLYLEVLCSEKKWADKRYIFVYNYDGELVYKKTVRNE